MIWIKTKRGFLKDDVNDETYENTPVTHIAELLDFRPYYFLSEEIQAYAQGVRENTSIIYYKNGEQATIEMKFSELDKIMEAEQHKLISRVKS